MKIKLTRQGSATLEEIKNLERFIEIEFPRDYADFLKHSDGAQLESNLFRVGDSNKSSVRSFLAVSEIVVAMGQIEELPPQTFPIATDDCGNSILLRAAKIGGVLFWDHEQPDSLIEIAPSFTSFLEMLEPFEIESVRLEPGQVKSVWVSPAF